MPDHGLIGLSEGRGVDGDYQVSIPNRGSYSEFSGTINAAVYGNTGTVIADPNRFTKAVLSADIGVLEKSLQNLIIDVLNARILDNEHAYQGFIWDR